QRRTIILSFCPRTSLHNLTTSGRQARCSSGVPSKFGNGNGSGNGGRPCAKEALPSNNEPDRTQVALRINDETLRIAPGDDALPFHPCQSADFAGWNSHDIAAGAVAQLEPRRAAK